MGSFYSRNGITIFHGDCLKILPELPAQSVDFVLTDPPYLVNYRGRWDGAKKTIIGDDDAAWVAPAFSEIKRVMKDDTLCVSFYGYPHADVFVGTWKALGFRIVSHIAFVKNVWGLGRFSRGQHETAYLLAKGHPAIPTCPISDTIEWEREQDAFHPKQKPVPALHPLIAAFAPEKGIVLDPLCGAPHNGSCVAKSIMWRPASFLDALVNLLRWTPHNGPSLQRSQELHQPLVLSPRLLRFFFLDLAVGQGFCFHHLL